MDFWTGFWIFFVLGTAYLIRRGVKRFFLFFMIRTRHGISLIDKTAAIAPGLWKFLADLAIVISFSGIGAAYLSIYGKRKSLYGILFIVGTAAILLFHGGLFPSLILLLTLLIALFNFYNLKNQTADFFFSVFVISVLGLQIFTVTYIALLEAIFGIPVILIIGLSLNAYDIIAKGSRLPGVSPLLPSTREGQVGVSFPGYDIFVPWFYALTAIVVTLVSHEFAHGVLARTQKMKVKSTGLLTFGIVPIGAFVEPDEQEVEKRPSIEKMRMFAAGSFANFVMAFAATILLIGNSVVIDSTLVRDGLNVVGFAEGYPAENVLNEGTVIRGIDGEPTHTPEAFSNVTSGIAVGSAITINTDGGDFTLKTAPSPENGNQSYVGIVMTQHFRLNEGIDGRYGFLATLLISVAKTLNWVFFFNLNIAMVNLLPIVPFDGWRMSKEAMKAFDMSEMTARRIVYAIVAATFLIFFINSFPLIRLLLD